MKILLCFATISIIEGSVLDPALYLSPSLPLTTTQENMPEKLWLETQQSRIQKRVDARTQIDHAYTPALPYPSELVAETEAKSDSSVAIDTKLEGEILVSNESAWGGHGWGHGGGGREWGHGGHGGSWGHEGHHGSHHWGR